MNFQPRHERIMQAIKDGILLATDIARACKLKSKSCGIALQELVEAGHIENNEDGKFQLPNIRGESAPRGALEALQSGVTAWVHFTNSQNTGKIAASFYHFGFAVLITELRGIKLCPPAGLNEEQIKAEISAILKEFTNVYGVTVVNAPKFAQIHPAKHLSHLEIKHIALGTVFDFHMQEYKVAKLLLKKRVDTVCSAVQFITSDEDGNLHLFEFDTSKKNQLIFKKFNGKI
jgi:hypothetical protein